MHLEGDRLHVKAPKGTLTPELRQALAERKADILEALREGRSPFDWGGLGYAEVMALSDAEFRRAGIAVVIESELVWEQIILASNEDVLRRLEGDGRAVFLPEEILLLEKCSPEEVRRLHTGKKLYGGTILPGGAR